MFLCFELGVDRAMTSVHNERRIIGMTKDEEREQKGSKERRSLLLVMVGPSLRCSPDSELKRLRNTKLLYLLLSVSFHPAKQSSSFLSFISRFSVPSTLLCRCVRPLILVLHLKRWKNRRESTL